MEVYMEINKPVPDVRKGGPPFEELMKLANMRWRGNLTLNPRDLVGPSAWRAASRVFAMPEPSMNIQGQAAWLCYITGQLTGVPYVRIPKTRAHVDVIANHLTPGDQREKAAELVRAAVTYASLRGALPHGGHGHSFSRKLEDFTRGHQTNFWFGFDTKVYPHELAKFLKQWMGDNDWPTTPLVDAVHYQINRQGGLPL
jgi:hypothetical protein